MGSLGTLAWAPIRRHYPSVRAFSDGPPVRKLTAIVQAQSSIEIDLEDLRVKFIIVNIQLAFYR